jgi:hypothetical protein
MGLMKVFSGSEILAMALKEKIEAIGVDTVMKDNIQSARLAGFEARVLLWRFYTRKFCKSKSGY